MSDLLDQSRIQAALDATWPPAACFALGPWMVRDGHGGGKRVSAATLSAVNFTQADIDTAQKAMLALNQPPLFAIWQGAQGLDSALAQRGYAVVDPVIAYCAPCSDLAASLPENCTAYPNWPPLALVQDMWMQAAIGPARLAVMARAQGTKTALLLRYGDHAVGVCFVALAGDTAMLHALEIAPPLRRQGFGGSLIRAAAAWAMHNRAQDLALVVTEANAPARALYTGLGMTEQGRYHYRMLP